MVLVNLSGENKLNWVFAKFFLFFKADSKLKLFLISDPLFLKAVKVFLFSIIFISALNAFNLLNFAWKLALNFLFLKFKFSLSSLFCFIIWISFSFPWKLLSFLFLGVSIHNLVFNLCSDTPIYFSFFFFSLWIFSISEFSLITTDFFLLIEWCIL